MLIGVVGFARSGKDSLADALVAELKSQLRHDKIAKLAFADPIKEDLQPCLDRYAKHGWDKEDKAAVRDLYITHGTRVGNQINSRMWVDELFDRVARELPGHSGLVISDVRRLEEADAINARNGYLIYAHRKRAVPADITEAMSVTEVVSVYRDSIIFTNLKEGCDFAAEAKQLLAIINKDADRASSGFGSVAMRRDGWMEQLWGSVRERAAMQLSLRW